MLAPARGLLKESVEPASPGDILKRHAQHRHEPGRAERRFAELVGPPFRQRHRAAAKAAGGCAPGGGTNSGGGSGARRPQRGLLGDADAVDVAARSIDERIGDLDVCIPRQEVISRGRQDLGRGLPGGALPPAGPRAAAAAPAGGAFVSSLAI